VTTPSPSLMSLLNPGAVSQGGTSSHRAALAVENAHNTMIAVCKFFLIHSSKNTIQYVIILAMETDFKVQVGEFEGPLEVLLDLIEKRKMHINDVSLATVADTFIEHINNYEEFPMGDSADFILIASTLLLIKSKSLLPNLELTEEEKVNIDDLEDRLAQYKKYKDLSTHISKMFGEARLYFARESKTKRVVFSPTQEISLERLLASVQNALNNVPRPEILPQVSVRKTVSLEEMIDNLRERVEKSIKLSFKDFAHKGKADKIDIIVSFLAVLELAKRGVVRISQEKHFDDISIETEQLSVPKY
jgi:segregation and condensation protein A